MSLIFADRVKETSTTTGTGTLTLAGAASGYQSFSAIGNANTCYYCIAHQSASEWEVGIGTYTVSGTTLSRDTILASSNSGSVVTFSAGTKDVFVTVPAARVGALVLLEQYTASASAALNFTSWYSSAYDEYMIEVVDLIPASASQTVSLQFSTDGGSSYDTGTNYGWSTHEWASAGAGVGGNSGNTDRIGLMRNIITTANYSNSGSYKLFNPGGSTYKKVIGQGNVSTGTNAEGQSATGIYRSTTAVNAFRVIMTSGDITSGTVRVYGVHK